MRKTKLNTFEKKVEKDIIENVYTPVSQKEFLSVAEAIQHRKKDAVLNIRINSNDLDSIKHKAKKLGLRYQTFISEILHKVAL